MVFLVTGFSREGLGMGDYIGLAIFDVNAVFDVDFGAAEPYIDPYQERRNQMTYKIRTPPRKAQSKDGKAG